jgi:hypothetical protein
MMFWSVLMSSAGHFDEELDLIVSRMAKRKLLLDHIVEIVVRRITGVESGYLGLAMATPGEVINDSNVHGDQFSNHQKRSCIGFGRCAAENAPTAGDFVHLHDNRGNY